MKFTVILANVLALAVSHSLRLEEQLLRDLWDQWKITHQKVYTMSEENDRFNTFAQNYLEIIEHNALNTDVTLGLNVFADLNGEEFKAKHLGLRLPHTKKTSNKKVFKTNDLPESVDWRTKGAVNAVKNQGNCGSCWSFSAVAALEGLNFIDSGNLQSFSEQNLVDCVGGECEGCNGGLMSTAFGYTAENGIQTEDDYPYTAVTGKCNANKKKATKVNTHYEDVTVGSAEQLKAAIAQQPVSVAVDAGGIGFRFYKKGVIKTSCTDNLNHGIAAVGYDSTNGSEAFIVRNSWGTVWGDAGYVRISTDATANGGNGVCGILKMNSYPVSK